MLSADTTTQAAGRDTLMERETDLSVKRGCLLAHQTNSEWKKMDEREIYYSLLEKKRRKKKVKSRVV
eukprot:scaffold6503_cov99-Amphora_coffeaeformis.AAC.5